MSNYRNMALKPRPRIREWRTELEVLVVDDNELHLRLVRTVLEDEGFAVRTASTAAQALDLARQTAPDLILMDISLPGMNGLDATRILKRDPATRQICVVGLSAHAMRGDAEKALAAGCDDYLTKPFNTRTLPPYLSGLLMCFLNARAWETSRPLAAPFQATRHPWRVGMRPQST